MAGSFTAANFNVAYNATSAVVTLTGLTAGYTFRITTTATGSTIFTGGAGSTATSRTISGGTFPAPGGVTTMYLQENPGSGFILSAIASATITRAAVPPPTALNFSDPGTFGTTVTITMSGSGGSGTYQYSVNNSTWTTTNTFTATRGSSYTYYIRSTFGAGVSTSISNSTTVSLDTTPTLGNYTNQTGVELSSTITSGTISVTAINAPASISVSGGSYSINGGAFTTAAGSVNLNDTVAVQHTSSGSYGTVTSTTVTIGGVGRTFTSTTASPDTTVTVSPSSFSVAYNADSNVLTSISGATAAHYYRIWNGLFGAFPATPGYVTGATTHSNIELFSAGPGANFNYDTQASLASGGPWVNTGNTITMVKAAVPAPATVSATMSGTAQLANITLSATGGSGNYEYSIDGTNWQVSGAFTGVTRNTTITLYARSTYVFLSTTYYSSNTTASYLVPYNEPDLDLTPFSIPTTTAYNSIANLTYSWTGQGSISRYKIQRNDAGTWVDVSAVAINATSRTLTYTEQDIPTPGNSASYKVVANVLVTNGGTGTFADTNISWTLSRGAVPVPSTPSGAAGGGASPTVTITASGGSGSYEYSLNGTSWQAGNTFASQTRGATLTLYTRSTYSYTYDSVTFFTAYSNPSSVSFIVPSAPTVNNTQTFLTTASNIIDHTVALSANGTGGTIEYAISTSNVYASVTGWQASATFTAAGGGVERGSSYYMWARRDVYAEAADASTIQTVPYLLPDASVTSLTVGGDPTTPVSAPLILTTNDTSNITVSWVGGSAIDYYRIVRVTGGITAVTTSLQGVSSHTLNFSESDLPPAGSSWEYKLQARKVVTDGGDNLNDDIVDTGNGNNPFYIQRIDTVPNAFSFTAVTGATPSTVYSTFTQITGIDTSTPVSINSGTGEFSISSTTTPGTWVTTGNITNNQYLHVRQTSSPNYGTLVSTIYNVGGVTGTYSVTTIVPPVVEETQLYDLTTAANTFSHNIALSSLGTGGTLEYAISTSATYNTSLIGTWQLIPAFTVTRGSTYYFWARRANAAGAADSSQQTIPYATGATIDSVVTITTTSPTTGYINGVMPATETSASFSLTNGSAITEYSIFKDFVPHMAFDNATSGTLTTTGGGLPTWGFSNSYSVQTRLSPNFGGNPSGTYTAATGTLNGAALSSWTMARKVYDPTINNITTAATAAATADVTVTATATNGTLEYSKDNGTNWQSSNIFTALTRGTSYPIVIIARGVATGTDSAIVVYAGGYTVPYLAPDSTITAIGPVTVATGATSFTVTIANGAANTVYEVRTTSYTGGVVGSLTGNGTLTVNDAPATTGGSTKTYYVTCYRTTASGGGGSGVVTNIQTFVATREILAPVVNDTQTPWSTEADDIIDHTILLSTVGEGGALQYAVSSSATYDTSLIYTWQASAAFTEATSTGLTRGSTYYFWARRDTVAAKADGAGPFTIPFLDPDSTITAIGPVTVATGATSFTVTIANGAANTVYEVRTTSYTGSVVGSLTGNGTLTVNDVPATTPGSTKTYYVTCYRTVATGGGGSGVTTQIQTFVATRGFIATNLAVGTVTNNSGGDLTGGSTANVIVTLSSGIQDQKYKLVRTNPTPVTDMAVGSVLGANGSTTLTLTYLENDLPTQNSIWTYKVQVIRETAQNGDNTWYDATGTGVSFTILRIWEPIVAEPQNFNTTTNSNTISHSIELKSEGAGGTLEYNVTTTATYPSTGWTTNSTFTLTRLTDYYLWARRSTDLADYDVTAALEVPAYEGSGNTSGVYGLQIYNSSGITIFDTSSRTFRLLESGSLSVPAGGTANKTVTGFNSSATSHVVVQTETTDTTGVKVTSDYGTQTFSVINNSSTIAKTVKYYVFKSDN